jgi:two-component system response regulator CpxR
VETPIPRASVAQEAPGSERRHRPVLVVEDDRAIREGLKSVVESDGREAYGAANGKEALELLRKIPRPGLILLDLMMPVMTGWEVLERLRADEAFATIPVVVVSAVPKREELGAVRVLQKPVDVTTLLRLIEEFCD